MGGPEAAFTGAAIKAGVDVIVRVVPKGFEWIKSWWLGKEFLIVGQARAGKTTFREYFQYGLFEDIKDTPETADIESSERFDVGIGRNSALQLIISSAVDIPGQVGAVAHANLVFDRNPHALIIVLDLTTPLQGKPDRASAAWLTRFCKRLEVKWRVNRKRSNRLKSIILVMNKADKVQSQTIDARKQVYLKIIEAELQDARGRVEDIPIMPCCIVSNPEGTKMVDAVISQLARAFARS